MRSSLLSGLFGFVIAFAAVNAAIGYDVDIEKVKCLVSGAAAKEDKTAEWKDCKVYFCCGNCQKKFTDDSKKYAAKANHQLVATKQVEQKACPFSGGDLNADTAIEFKGAKIAFCCKNCMGKAEKMSDDEKVEKLFGEDAYDKAKFEKPETK